MIDWTKYFDKIYCVNNFNYKQRRQLLQLQLKRVGILDSGIFEWETTFNNTIDQIYENMFFKKNKGFFINGHQFQNRNLILGHYEMIRNAFNDPKCERALFLEDDIRFLKDLNQIEEIIKNRPKNYNLILYDKFFNNLREIKKCKPINQYFITFQHLYFASCYQLDKKGMKRILQLIETEPKSIDNYWFDRKFYLTYLDCAASKKNIAIQINYSDNNSNNKVFMSKDPKVYQIFYKFQNVDYKDYNVYSDERDFNYGDQIIVEKKQNSCSNSFNLSNEQVLTREENVINVLISIKKEEITRTYPLLYSFYVNTIKETIFYICLDVEKQDLQHYFRYFQPFSNEKMKICLISKIDRLIQNVQDIFPQLNKVLFIKDCEYILVNKGLQQFYNLDLSKYFLGVVQEYQFLNKHYDKKMNSEVILFNLDKMRREKRSDFEFNYLAERGIIKDVNQFSLLQNRYKGEILYINPVFNNYLTLNNEYGIHSKIFRDFLNMWGIKDEQDLVNKTILVKTKVLDKRLESKKVQQLEELILKDQKNLIDKCKQILGQTISFLKFIYSN